MQWSHQKERKSERKREHLIAVSRTVVFVSSLKNNISTTLGIYSFNSCKCHDGSLVKMPATTSIVVKDTQLQLFNGCIMHLCQTIAWSTSSFRHQKWCFECPEDHDWTQWSGEVELSSTFWKSWIKVLGPICFSTALRSSKDCYVQGCWCRQCKWTWIWSSGETERQTYKWTIGNSVSETVWRCKLIVIVCIEIFQCPIWLMCFSDSKTILRSSRLLDLWSEYSFRR